MRRRRARNRQADVQPLRHRDREAPGHHGCDLEAVHRDQLAIELAEIDVKGAHGGAVDDAQQHAPAGLDLHHIGIAESTVVGQERIIGDVVQIRLGGSAHCHARGHRTSGRTHCLHFRWRVSRWRVPRHRGRHRGHLAALLELREDLLRRREAEVSQHQDDFLLVGPVALIADDQRRRHQQLLLQALVRVHPVRSAETQREIVVGAAPRRYRRSGDAGDAVLLPGWRKAVPVDQAGFVDPVFHADAKPGAHLGPDAEGTGGLLDSVHRRRLAVHLDAAALQPQHRLRFIVYVRPRRGPSLRTRARRHKRSGRGGRQQQGTA